jgi:hypothetical protein
MPPARRKGASKSPSRSPSRSRSSKGSRSGSGGTRGKHGAVRVRELGCSIVGQMMEHDPAPRARQVLFIVLTASLLLALPCFPTALQHAVPALAVGCGGQGSAAPYSCASGWDASHYDAAIGVTWGPLPLGGSAPGGVHTVVTLLLRTTGLSIEELQLAAAATAAAFGLLFVADLLSAVFPQTIGWPTSWQTENRQCYTEMFSEPTRESLVRRPGNVYSNFLYLFTGLAVLQSCAKEQQQQQQQQQEQQQEQELGSEANPFWLADASEWIG